MKKLDDDLDVLAAEDAASWQERFRVVRVQRQPEKLEPVDKEPEDQ